MHHHGPHVVYVENLLQVGNAGRVTIIGWYAVYPGGLSLICQNGIMCQACRARSGDAISSANFLSCGTCDYRNKCHQIMAAHVQTTGHGHYF